MGGSFISERCFNNRNGFGTLKPFVALILCARKRKECLFLIIVV